MSELKPKYRQRTASEWYQLQCAYEEVLNDLDIELSNCSDANAIYAREQILWPFQRKIAEDNN